MTGTSFTCEDMGVWGIVLWIVKVVGVFESHCGERGGGGEQIARRIEYRTRGQAKCDLLGFCLGGVWVC